MIAALRGENATFHLVGTVGELPGWSGDVGWKTVVGQTLESQEISFWLPFPVIYRLYILIQHSVQWWLEILKLAGIRINSLELPRKSLTLLGKILLICTVCRITMN